MPATSSEIKLIRRATGDDETSFATDDINLLWDDAADEYASYSRRVQRQAVIVARLRELRVKWAGEVDYDEGDASESLSDVHKNLDKEVKSAEMKLADLIIDEDQESRSSVKILGARRGRRRRSRPHGSNDRW